MMDAFVGFHFMFEHGEPAGSHYVIKFDVTPDARLAAIWKRRDDEFEARLNEFFDEELEIYGEDWETGNFDLFGWLTHDLDREDDTLLVVEKVRDFFLKEGFRGGDIIQMTEKAFDQMAAECKTHVQLEAALMAFMNN
jgi:hypothetical protein